MTTLLYYISFFIIGALIGFVAGWLVSRKHNADIENVIRTEYERAQKTIDTFKKS